MYILQFPQLKTMCKLLSSGNPINECMQASLPSQEIHLTNLNTIIGVYYAISIALVDQSSPTVSGVTHQSELYGSAKHCVRLSPWTKTKRKLLVFHCLFTNSMAAISAANAAQPRNRIYSFYTIQAYTTHMYIYIVLAALYARCEYLFSLCLWALL